jgi:hypothetical protein
MFIQSYYVVHTIIEIVQMEKSYICNQLNMDWYKMDSIVIMDNKWILFITIVSKLKGHIY